MTKDRRQCLTNTPGLIQDPQHILNSGGTLVYNPYTLLTHHEQHHHCQEQTPSPKTQIKHFQVPNEAMGSTWCLLRIPLFFFCYLWCWRWWWWFLLSLRLWCMICMLGVCDMSVRLGAAISLKSQVSNVASATTWKRNGWDDLGEAQGPCLLVEAQPADSLAR